jgi:hypothetical protein
MRRATVVIVVAAAWLPLAGWAAVPADKRPDSYTLSSWKGSLGHWDFSLVSKTYWYTAGNVDELKQQLSQFPAGTRIGWYTRPEIGFVYPPRADVQRDSAVFVSASLRASFHACSASETEKA